MIIDSNWFVVSSKLNDNFKETNWYLNEIALIKLHNQQVESCGCGSTSYGVETGIELKLGLS